MHTSPPGPSSLLPLTVAALCALLGACNPAEVVDDAEQQVSLPVVPFDNALTVSDQRPDPANAVLIRAVTLDEETSDALLVIRESDAGGFPSRTIGALRVNASGADITVPLERDVLAGERLHASLYEAPGDDAPLDFMTALPLLGPDGLPVQQPFSISPPDAARLVVAPEQASSGRVYIDALQIDQVEATTQNSLIVAFGEPDLLFSEVERYPIVALLPVQGFSAQNLTIALSPLDPDTTQRFPNDTPFLIALFQDNAPLGSFGAEDVLELDDAGEPVSASITASLEPHPSASLSCNITHIACDLANTNTLTVDLDIQADYDGFILAQYTDTEGATRSALSPVPAGASSLDTLTLPSSIACDAGVRLSLLVDLPGFSQEQLLALEPSPIARDAENTPQQCAITAREPGKLVSDLALVDEDTISAEIFAPYLTQNPSEALFLAISTTGDTPTLVGTRRLTESLSQIEVDLVAPISSGDTLLFKLYLDGGEPFIFEPEGGVDAPLFLDEANTQPAEQTVTVP